MGTLIVFLIIGFSAFYVIRKIYISFKNNDVSGDGCGGGCSSCSENCGCKINEYYPDESSCDHTDDNSSDIE